MPEANRGGRHRQVGVDATAPIPDNPAPPPPAPLEGSVRFPGHRNRKHYFPVTGRQAAVGDESEAQRWPLVGLDEVLVDVEVTGSAALARELGLVPGESVQLSDAACGEALERLGAEGRIRSYSAGGTVANTLNNYTYLSGQPAVLLGAMPRTIHPGGPAFAYVAQTPKHVDLSLLRAVEGTTGIAITFFSEDGERAFGVSPGIAGEYPADAVPEEVVRGAAIALTTLYCLRPADRPICGAALRMMAVAAEAGVPVAFGLGTAGLVREMRGQVRDLLEAFVTIAAMNLAEAEALTGEADGLLAGRALLDLVDLVVITEGSQGLTLCGYTDERVRRETREGVRSKAIADYNRWEFSRLVRRADCERPLRIYSHIHPYHGGPDRLSNTSGAGDAALAAILHDIAANDYHRATVPESRKHAGPARFLTYSSLSRNAQYGNRVAYEVLKARSPRLDGPVDGDPEGD